MPFHSTSSDLLWLEKKPGNLGEEKTLGKQSRGLGSRDDRPHHPQIPSTVPIPPSLTPPSVLLIAPPPPQLDNTERQQPSQSLLVAWPGSFWVSVGS